MLRSLSTLATPGDIAAVNRLLLFQPVDTAARNAARRGARRSPSYDATNAWMWSSKTKAHGDTGGVLQAWPPRRRQVPTHRRWFPALCRGFIFAPRARLPKRRATWTTYLAG